MNCPNCLTPLKCNGPHLEKINENYYSSYLGYFVKKEQNWNFLPLEREYCKEELLDIAETLSRMDKLLGTSF